ncbi:MAG: hypothetical protein HQL29_02095 [Candidatus Omnitrophica bacterium]|nr:hypothetical protein [Candidatus Omnitrophota bacterium]
MKKLFFVLFMVCVLLKPETSHAGAWTLPQKDTWVEFLTKFNWAKDDFINEAGEMRRKGNDARSWGWSMEGKMEYGAYDWLTLLGGVTFKTAYYKEYARNPSWGPYSASNHAVTDFHLGGRWRILKEPFVVSLQAKYFFYTGYAEDGGGLNDLAEVPGLSDRTDALDMRVLIARQFQGPYPWFFGIETGYRINMRNIADQVPFFAEVGVWPTNWMLFKGEVDCMYAADDHEGNRLIKEYAIWRIGPTFELLEIYDLFNKSDPEDVSVEAATNSITRQGDSLNVSFTYGQTFWGKNVSADQEVMVKASAQF